MSSHPSRRLAVMVGGFALATMGVIAAGQAGLAASADSRVPAAIEIPLTPGDPSVATTTETATTAATASPSYAPANPVDCTDPNNVINCQAPPVDSPLVSGTAEPGSPYRD